MSWPVYTKQLLVVSGPPGTYTAVVPPLKTWIVTHMIAIQPNEAVAGDVYVSSSAGTAIWWAHAASGATDGNHFWESKVVLPAGAILTAAITAGNWDLTATGYELDA